MLLLHSLPVVIVFFLFATIVTIIVFVTYLCSCTYARVVVIFFLTFPFIIFTIVINVVDLFWALIVGYMYVILYLITIIWSEYGTGAVYYWWRCFCCNISVKANDQKEKNFAQL